MTELQKLIRYLADPDPAQRKRAIIALAKRRETGAVHALSVIREKDDVPELRQLAAKAIRHIQTSADPLRLDEADHYFKVALERYRTQGASAAAAPLNKAVSLDPTLADEKITQTITAQIAAVPSQSAWHPRRSRRVRTYLLAIIVLAVLSVMIFLNSQSFKDYLFSLQVEQWRGSLYRDGAIAYYAFVPESVPPENGWPVLLILDDDARDIEAFIPTFIEPAQKAQALLVVPIFEGYTRPYNEHVTPLLDQILIHVRQNYPVHARGEVLFGFSVGGEIVTLYAQQYGTVAAVVAIGATDLHLPAPDDTRTRYLISYGEEDELLFFNEPSAQEFDERENPAEFLIIEGVGHEITQQQLDWTMDLFGLLFRD